MSVLWCLQTSSKVQESAGKLASAIKTGRTLQMLEVRQADVAKNREHQQNYEKQLKVISHPLLHKMPH